MKGETIYLLRNDQIEAILKHFGSYTKMAIAVNEKFSNEPKIYIEYIEEGVMKTIRI